MDTAHEVRLANGAFMRFSRVGPRETRPFDLQSGCFQALKRLECLTDGSKSRIGGDSEAPNRDYLQRLEKVELGGFEPPTSWVRSRRSAS
jgi:hypothetical protein